MSIIDSMPSEDETGFSVAYDRKEQFWDALTSRPMAHLIALLTVFVTIGPIVVMLFLSLITGGELSQLDFLPSHPLEMGWERYSGLIGDAAFQNAFVSSLAVSLASTAIVVVLGVPAGYVFSRYRFQYDTWLFLGVILTRVIPPVAVIVPYYRMLIWLDLINTHTGLIIAHVYLWLPFVIILMRFFFDAIPRDIDEAARVDGCTDVQALLHVVLPIAWPGLTASALLAFIFSWREYLFSTMVISNEASLTLPVYAARYGQSPEFIVTMAVTAIALVFVFQRHMIRSFEFVSGGIKK